MTSSTAAMRLLVISRGGHPGIDDALDKMLADATLTAAAHIEMEPVDRATSLEAIEKRVRDEQFDAVVFHHYHGGGLADPGELMAKLRLQDHRPVVAFTGGDPFYDGFFRPSHPAIFRSASNHADIVMNSSMGESADAIVGYGAERVALLPLGVCQVRFPKPAEPHNPSDSEFDVCFIGSNNRSRNPAHSYFWYSRKRERLMRQLHRRFGERFAIYGNGWEGMPGNRGPIPFDQQLQACRTARVVVGGVPYSPARYYASNRPFNQIMSGVPFVDIAVEGAETLLRNGEHWHLAESLDGVADRVDELLHRPDEERVEMGDAAASFVAENHTHEHRWRTLHRLLSSLRGAILAGEAVPPPVLDFLIPEARTPREVEIATRGYTPMLQNPEGCYTSAAPRP